MSQKVGEAALGIQGYSRVGGNPGLLGGTPGVLCWGQTPQRGPATKVCPEVAASGQLRLPALEEDLSFSKSLKVAPGKTEAKSESKSECQ